MVASDPAGTPGTSCCRVPAGHLRLLIKLNSRDLQATLWQLIRLSRRKAGKQSVHSLLHSSPRALAVPGRDRRAGRCCNHSSGCLDRLEAAFAAS